MTRKRHLFNVSITTMILTFSTFNGLMATASEEPNYQLGLMEHLMDNYGRGYARPVKNSRTPTRITFRCLLGELIEMDTRQQKLTVSAYLKMTWTDEYLRWDSSKWGNTTSLHIPAHALWFPDLSLYNNVDKGWMSLPTGMHLVVTPDGVVKWYSPAILTSSCRQRVKFFPFDTQVCLLRFCSWSAHSEQIEFVPEVGSDSSQDRFLEDGTWRFMHLNVEQRMINYTCCPKPFSELYYHVLFRRRSDFYVTYLILPCILLSVLSLMVFYLPTDCGEKLTLSITNLLALVVFQQMISETMPPSGDAAPILGTYFTSMIIMVCISVLLTVVIIHFGFNTRPMPRWVEWLILEMLGKVFCLSEIEENKLDFIQSPHYENCLASGTIYPLDIDSREHHDLTMDQGPNGVSFINDIRSNGSSIFYQNSSSPYVPELVKIVQQLDCIRQDVIQRHKLQVVSRKWKRVATIIDRTLLYSFVVIAVSTTAVMMLQVRSGGETDYNTQFAEFFSGQLNESISR